MLNKSAKVKVIENYYALDFYFFGKKAEEMEGSCCEGILAEYKTYKSALMSVLIEFYKTINYSPNVGVKNIQQLQENAVQNAKISRKISKTLLQHERSAADIKTKVMTKLSESSKKKEPKEINKIVREATLTKQAQLGVDALLIAQSLLEAKKVEVLLKNDIDQQLLRESYKLLRDGLVDTARVVLSTEA